MYEIRKIRPNEVEDALNPALEVFMQFEAPVYKREGVETFKKDKTNPQHLLQCSILSLERDTKNYYFIIRG